MTDDAPSVEQRIRRAGLCVAFAADVVAITPNGPDGLCVAAAGAALRLADADLSATVAPRLCGLTDTGELIEPAPDPAGA